MVLHDLPREAPWPERESGNGGGVYATGETFNYQLGALCTCDYRATGSEALRAPDGRRLSRNMVTKIERDPFASGINPMSLG